MWCKSFYFETPTYPRPEFSDPKILKMCDPSLVTLTKMQPHNSQSSRENLGAHPHYTNTTDPSPLPPQRYISNNLLKIGMIRVVQYAEICAFPIA